MKSFNWRPLALFFGFMLVFGGINAFIQSLAALAHGVGLGIWALFNFLPHLPTSFYSLVAQGVTTSWTLTNIVWLDTILVNIATFIPSIITFYISKVGFKLSPGISTIISVIILLFVLELFASVVFWIVLALIAIISIITLILHSKKFSYKDYN